MTEEFFGFQRKDGSVGIRNYVGIISAMDNVNPIARKIVENVYGTVLITDLFGRKLMGTNHKIRAKALTGLGKNPNLGGVMIVFNTGIGNPAANPATPTVKLTGNPFTVQKSADDLDIDVSDIISNGVSIEAAGERIFKEILSVANGKMTFSEIFGASQSTISVAGASY